MNKKALIILFICLANSAFTLSACAETSYDENVGSIDLTSMSVSGTGIEVEDNCIKITEGGDFTVTGENSNGMIYINSSDKVKLRLSGMSLKNENGPAIFYENTEKALITITEGTENYIEDGSDYGTIDAKAAIFSNDDIEIKGNGTLNVAGNYKHAIASDDDIVIENGTINLTSNGTDGIHVNNTFSMTGGTLNISAISDGIQSEEDVIIDGGVINITKSEEGIESGTTLTVNGGEINITSTDDGFNSGGGTGTGDTMKPGGRPDGPGKNMSGEMSMEDMPAEDARMGERPDKNIMQQPSDMPAEPAEVIRPSYEPQSADVKNEPSQDTLAIDCSTYINGGTIHINAEGDGIDSNASIYITGGEIYVNGPQNGGDGAIDGNKLVISGGTLWATGNSGMAMGASEESSQCAFLVNLTENINSGETVQIKDANNNIISEYTANKQFNSIVFSDASLTEGETYDIYVNNEKVQSIEMTAKQVSYGSKSFGGGRGGRDFVKAVPSDDSIKVLINGKKIEFDTEPIIQNDTVLVPVRSIFEGLGLSVEWDDAKKQITAVKDGLTIKLTAGSTSALKNDQTVSLSTAPVITADGRTLVPVRFISESCGLSVEWDENTKTVYITE